LEKFSREFKKPGLTLSDEAKDRLLHYRWPGNVRELQNALERAVILADGDVIQADGLQLLAARPDTSAVPAGLLAENFSWNGTLEEVTGRALGHVEKVILENALRECKWNKTRTAEMLGVSAKTLLVKMRGAGLEE
jgi:DNA-binding NtrC family response regulator